MKKYINKWAAIRGGYVIASVAFVALTQKLHAHEYTRIENFVQPEIVRRANRLAQSPQLYAEFLCKYGMFHNYLHYWIDRPLYWNRSLRPAKFEYETINSFAVHARELRKSGLDGFDMFANLSKGKADNIKRFNEWLVKIGEDSLKIVPTISYGEAIDKYGPNPSAFVKAIGDAQKDPRFPRLGGKVLVPTYNYRIFGVEQHRQFMKMLKTALGNDDFVLCGDINHSELKKLRAEYYANGALSDVGKNKLEQLVRDVLDICGGIQLMVDDRIRDVEGEYCSRYDTSFFENCTAPVVKWLLSLPEYAGKALGFYVQQGYINHHSGHNHAEDGTDTLRREMAAILQLDPDYLIFFEWNEANENTMFQPTVWNGHAVSRILRWYSNLMKGKGVSPFPEDNHEIPCLTLSHRATAKVGEVLRFEILNVPDGVRSGKIPVQLKLEDMEGTIVQVFPEEQIDETRFGSITYIMPTIDLKADSILCPTLLVAGKKYSNFHPIRLAPTVSWNYKMVRQNLRDKMDAKCDLIDIKSCGENKYMFSADLKFDEKLASVELISQESEVTAYTLGKEYDLNKNELLRIALTAPPGDTVRNAEFALTVLGASNCVWKPLWVANVNHGVSDADCRGDTLKACAGIWSEEVGYFVQIPKESCQNSVIEVAFTNVVGCDKVYIPVKAVLEQGVYAVNPRNNHPLRIDVKKMEKLPDLPCWIGKQDCQWTGEFATDQRNPVFHFRAISESGKIWRSRPFRQNGCKGEMIEIPVWDEYARRPGKGLTSEGMIPEITYVFSPASSAAIVNTWESLYCGQLGGGFMADQAFRSSTRKVPLGSRTPKWTKEDGEWCLSFDGTNDYINLPREAFPQAAFTLEMEVKPEIGDEKCMVLFRHFGRLRGSLSLFIRNGKLFATWGSKDLKHDGIFETDLEIRDGQWNSICVSYDFSALTFRVNSNEKKILWQGRAYAFMPSVFGGHDEIELSGGKEKPAWFKGLLRRLSIRHK